MINSKYYHYYVEGETDEKMASILKTDYQYIVSGKIEKFNVIQQELTSTRTMGLKRGTAVILVFDTDTNNSDILDKNITFLKKQKNISNVICIPQVDNLEDELKRSCRIKQIKELTGSKSNREFKNDMIKQNNFKNKLDDKAFNFRNFWNSLPKNHFSYIKNEASTIKRLPLS